MAFPWNDKEALGLPKGSVRALLTVTLTYGYLYMTINSIPIPPEYSNLTIGALGLYVLPRVTSEMGDFLATRRGPDGK